MTGERKILLVAFPGHGLISPSLRFADRLLKMGVSVTFCTCNGLLPIIKETIPHGLTIAPFSDGHDNGVQPTDTLQQLISDFAKSGSAAVADLITSAAAKGQPFDHLVYTTIVPWVANVANAHNVTSTLLWCQPATVFNIYYYYFNEYQELISSNKNNPLVPIKLPGLPSFFLPSTRNDCEFMLSLYKQHIDVIKTNSSILINSFDELENESIKAIEKIKYIPIGPLIPSESLEKEEDGIINWLNTKPKKSVVYVSFVRLSHLSSDQAEEMAKGLLESGRPFLWVIRDSGEAAKLSNIDELKKQGMIVDWCSQVAVLNHDAIGCFVTNCGWNSTVEALAAGVPIVAYPQWTDQGTNAKMIEDVWKIGVRVKKGNVDEVVEGKEIARCVEMVIGDEAISSNALKWKELSSKAVQKGGSSSVNLEAFLDDA
nr:crocetin glucosyltransferase, chloroplastic-like [Tanacetum cinerariifolium]